MTVSTTSQEINSNSNRNYILEYWHEIVTKQEVVSLKVYKQYKKLAKDIEHHRANWIFDNRKAHHAIDFIERYCKHSKGKWGGKPIVLELWQKALISAAFGFIDKGTGLRKYTEVLLIVARKNGKSTLAAAVGLYLQIADGEPGSEVYAVATKKDQAKLIWQEAKRMVRKSPALRKRIKTLVAEMVGIGKYEDTFFKPLGSDSDTLDGLNPHGACLDEIHAWKNKGLYDVIYDGMTARAQPMLLETTTAGTVRALVYDEKYDYASKVIDGLDDFDDERLLPIIYELDDRKEWTDPECWKKANPGLGTIKDKEKLADKVRRARRVPDQLSNLLCKDFNIRDTVAGSWLTFDEANNEATFDMEELRDCYGIGGNDLAATTDLAYACIEVMKPGSEQIYLIGQGFMPADTIEDRSKEDKVPYDKWAERGFITLSPGNKIDYRDITDWYIKIKEEYGIIAYWAGYDSWNSPAWLEDMENRMGYKRKKNLLPVIMGAKTLSAPMKELKADLGAKRINYNNNPLIKWALTNVTIEVDKNENIRPIKGSNQRQRIDPAVSLIIAHTELMNNLEDYRGLIGG